MGKNSEDVLNSLEQARQQLRRLDPALLKEDPLLAEAVGALASELGRIKRSEARAQKQMNKQKPRSLKNLFREEMERLSQEEEQSSQGVASDRSPPE